VSTRWTAADLPDQTGRTWLVTGATSGIGLETARAASAVGAELVLAVRNRAKGEAVAASLPGAATVLTLDLGSLTAIRRAAAATPEIDVLVNNAGRITTRREETEDGFECLLGTNALGPFAYTNLIADRVRERVVIVGSGAHRSGVLDLSDPHFRRRRWSPGAAYAQSKLADLVWGLGLWRRLAGRSVQLCHPGWAGTGISNVTGHAGLDRVVTGANALLAQSPAQGALPTLFAATQEFPPCSYVGPGGFNELRGHPTLVGRTTAAASRDLADAWWGFAAAETGTDLR